MPFEAETLLARAVKEEVAKLALQRQATAETLAKYVDTSKADGLLYSQAKKFSAALDNEIKFWDKQSQIASKKQNYLSMIDKAQKQADVIMKISAPIAGIGAAITAPLLSFANAYLQSAGKTEVAGQRYQDAMYKFQTAEIRVGRQVTESLVPALETAADLAEKISKYAEDHPEVIQGLIGLGTGASVLGTVGLSVGLLTKSLADIASLAAKLGLGGAAAGGAGTAVTGGATAAAAATIAPIVVSVLSLLAGAGIGKYIGEAVNQGTVTPNLAKGSNVITDIEKTLSTLAGVIGGITTGSVKDGSFANTDRGKEWAIAAERFFGLIEKSTPTMAAATIGAKSFSDKIAELNDNFNNSPQKSQIVDAYSQYQTQLKNALEQFNQSVIETQNQFAAAVAQENANYQKSVSSAIANYQKASASADAAYYAQREQALADHNKEMKRMAEDHQRKLRELEESHNDRLNSLAADRDALGIAQENVAYAKAVKSENENYDLERKRREEDFKDQLKQMDENYAAQKAERDAALAEQLAQLEVSHNEQLAALQKNENEKLATLQKSYAQQVAMLDSAFVQRIRDLDGRILADYSAYQKSLQDLADGFGKWLDDFNKSLVDRWTAPPDTSTPNTTPPATVESIGGYSVGSSTQSNTPMSGFSTGSSAKLADKLIGGKLSQRGLLDALTNRSSSGGNEFSINVAGRGMTSRETRKIARDEVSTNFDLLTQALK